MAFVAPVYDVAVVGGGIVGCATALALLERNPELRLILLEKEGRLAAHQTGHNSGVIHSGLYYRPGSLKARNCVAGREALYAFCREHGIDHERCGKVVVATSEEELPLLDELERRGRANGLRGLERLDSKGVREFEPHVAGLAGLHVPETGIVDFTAVTEAMGRRVTDLNGVLACGARVRAVSRRGRELALDTPLGTMRCRSLINCAGLHSDRVARLAGIRPEVRIVPFRGEYYLLRADRRRLVRRLVYPVPDPAFPFLGVHYTRMIDGSVEAGPNAVLALKREGYARLSFSPRDAWETLAWPGFWRLAGRYWRMGWKEVHRSFSRRRFVADLRRLVPELEADDVEPGPAGVRAQALDRAGRLLDDFAIVEEQGMLHVLNAPSPAATAALSIGRTLAERLRATSGFN